MLLHCPTSSDLWAFLFCLVGIAWVMPSSVNSMLESWSCVLGSCRCTTVQGATPACLMWCILGERNRCTFDYKESSVPNLKFLLWRPFMNGVRIYSFSVFIDGVSRLCVFAINATTWIFYFSFLLFHFAVFFSTLYLLYMH